MINTIVWSRTTEEKINGWWVFERHTSNGQHGIALVDDKETIRHVSMGDTRELCLIGLENCGYTIPESIKII